MSTLPTKLSPTKLKRTPAWDDLPLRNEALFQVCVHTPAWLLTLWLGWTVAQWLDPHIVNWLYVGFTAVAVRGTFF